MITVIIPPQKFTFEKYAARQCYLYDALLEAGHKNVSVVGFGQTKIGDTWYTPREAFDGVILMNRMNKGLQTVVDLEPVKSIEI